MALRLSTGLRQYLLGGGSMRKGFCDSILQIYSGSAPATADLPSTGELLVEITKASGSYSHDAVSTPKQSTVTIVASAAGNINTITISGEAFTRTSPGGGETTTVCATALCALIEASKTVPVFAACQAAIIYIKSKFPGEDYSISVAYGGGGTIPTLSEDSPAESRIDALHLGVPAAGVIAKETGFAWSGEIDETGTAGYFRLVLTTDDDDDSATAIRLQGSISTSGAELNLSNLNLVDGATLTIDVFSLNEPAS
jgi:hypothetical protein